jgi:hypothetical protein
MTDMDNTYSKIHLEVSYETLLVLIKLLPKRGPWPHDGFDAVALAVNPITTTVNPSVDDWGNRNVL